MTSLPLAGGRTESAHEGGGGGGGEIAGSGGEVSQVLRPGLKNCELIKEASTPWTMAPLKAPIAGTQRSTSSTGSSSAEAPPSSVSVNPNTTQNSKQTRDLILMGLDDGLSA